MEETYESVMELDAPFWMYYDIYQSFVNLHNSFEQGFYGPAFTPEQIAAREAAIAEEQRKYKQGIYKVVKKLESKYKIEKR